MAGHMGAARVTTQNLQVVKTDVELGIIMIKGAGPGSKGGWVTIKDAVKKDLPDNVIYPAALLASVKDIEEVVNVSPEEVEEKIANVGAGDGEIQLAGGTAPEGGKKDES
jgi:large subunit ribosomal protein L3